MTEHCDWSQFALGPESAVYVLLKPRLLLAISSRPFLWTLHRGEKATVLLRQMSKPFLGAWCTGN